ncbi:MAG: transglutaminase domain-containing protein [Reichenbachiella sp.]|uniref:transglutaminase domain-containing protein n=1 Tax=Reichenbachiella sp. TaxID=2184521 RepID=UPI003262DEDC
MKAISVLFGVFMFCHLSAQIPESKNTRFPEHADHSYKELINYVTQAYTEKNDIAKFFYYWMAQNIQYDYAIAENLVAVHGQVTRPYALDVFESKRTICSGYAILYKLFLNEFDIECEVVDGYAKSKEGLILSDSLEIAHTWNVVRLENTWSLVDVTWAATTRVEEKVSPFFYRTPPELFVFNHFPFIPYWQLAEQPISLNEFRRLPEVNAEYYDLGFAALAPKLLKEDSKYKLIIGKSKEWKPIISKSLTGKEYETVQFKSKDLGNYQELIFQADESKPFIIRLDAYQPIDWQHQVTQTQLAYVVMQ